jgi:hypothetical protein
MKTLVACIAMCAVGASAGAQSTPAKLSGAAGPRAEILSKNVAGAELLDVAVEPFPVEPGKESSQTMAAGTSRFRFTIKLSALPPEGTEIKVQIENDSGPVERTGYASYVQKVDPKTGATEIALRPPSTEPYPGGAYRATVLVGDVRAAVLNWSIAPTP